ncbi:hypothetical protein [Rhodospira trueperi]|uniref:Uncharacterized protein n=1 Tax=Rhodospira trueperi TaxID=69960 RepID=A0A1G6X373_9PROT|nr:hypothetical protein [Rhodospira trueperi]SDD72519.1 hypothetical protein SAMN05421720_101356 [Rhodospira trueperi]
MSMNEEEARREIARLVELHGPGILMDAAGKTPARRKPGPKPGQRRNRPPQEYLDEMADLIVTGAVKGRTDGVEAAARAIAVKYLGMPSPLPIAESDRWRSTTAPLVRNFRDQKGELLARARERAKPKIVQVPKSALWSGFDIANLACDDPLTDPRIGTPWERLKAAGHSRPDSPWTKLIAAGATIDHMASIPAHIQEIIDRENRMPPHIQRSLDNLKAWQDTPQQRAIDAITQKWADIPHQRAIDNIMQDLVSTPHQQAIEEALRRAGCNLPKEVESPAQRMMRERFEKDLDILNGIDPLHHIRRGGPGSGI